MRAFDIHEPLPAAGLVLVLMNVATLFPLWPGNIGLVQAAVALPLYRYYGVAESDRHRVRVRPAGDRGVGRDRRRPDLPRARGPVVRDAEGDARRVAGGSAGGDRTARRADRRPMPSNRALACPASLKGVLTARDAAAALAEACATWAEVDELPVADGGEGTLDVLHPSSAASGARWRSTTRSGDRALHGGFGSRRCGGPSRRPRRFRSIPRDSTRSPRRRAGSAS